ncbi:hypothetical protein [Paenibacillus taichungensis]|uniref:hypothetical protein n=1 Tax=Paenibacillus taichungensis TaxID=484184 RepID=UPI002877595D|nr:hypothetical protein [Paenibacillus taichungensis]
MDQIKMRSSRELYKMSFKRNPLIDFRKFESYISLIFSLVFTVIVYFYVSSNSEVEYITSNTKDIVLYTIFGLLGMLGFIISGLAIISGTIGHNVTKNIIKAKKFNSLLKIMFSFNYLGHLLGFLIVVFIFIYFILSINSPFVKWAYISISAMLSYAIFFVIFFAISLLKTCLDIFVINYLYSDEEEMQESNNVEMEFINLKTDTITQILSERNLIDKDSFIAKLKQRVDEDIIDDSKKKELMKKISDYYSVD